MVFPTQVTVTGQVIDLAGLTEQQRDYYQSLAKKLAGLYSTRQSTRMAVGLSGPSGSGKSVAAAILHELLSEEQVFTFYTLDLDAFHFSNEYLANHVGVDGTLLSYVKGRYDTYDVHTLASFLAAYKRGEALVLPTYSRTTHEPSTDGVILADTNALLLVAGLWLQRDDDAWAQIRERLDHTIAITGSKRDFERNTITRHIRGGRTPSEAQSFFLSSDKANTLEIETHSVSPNETISYYADAVLARAQALDNDGAPSE